MEPVLSLGTEGLSLADSRSRDGARSKLDKPARARTQAKTGRPPTTAMTAAKMMSHRKTEKFDDDYNTITNCSTQAKPRRCRRQSRTGDGRSQLKITKFMAKNKEHDP